jgi:hypothetical protein
MTQSLLHSRRDADQDQEILVRLRGRLQQIKSRLIDIEAQVDALRTTKKAMTLRKFTEKQLNGKRPDDQETDFPHRRTAPRNVQRADIAPANGYAIVVDGDFTTQFSEENAAKTSASELLANFPMLQVEVYNAKEKSRTLLK